MTKLDIACQALFTGRINVPKAASLCGIAAEEMKANFVDYVKTRDKDDWEVDITMSWPYA